MTFDDHDHDRAPRALGARRDLLGIGALLGADSGLVPISDLDAGQAWPAECATESAGADSAARTANLPAVCGACTTRCATVELALGRADDCQPERTS